MTSKHFFYGTATNNYQYGLYDTITNRIVLTSDKLNILNTLQIILSSKYNLHILDLTSASNWNTSLLDNTICYNWGINYEIPVCNAFGESILQKDATTINELVDFSSVDFSSIDINELIYKDQEYFMLVYKIIERFLDICPQGPDNMARNLEFKIVKTIGLKLPIDLMHGITTESVNDIFRVLYLGNDVDSTINEIKQIDTAGWLTEII